MPQPTHDHAVAARRAVVSMEFRLGLYQWLTRLQTAHQGCWAWPVVAYLTFFLLIVGLEDSIIWAARALPFGLAALWVVGGVLLAWWPLATLMSAETANPLRRGGHIAALLPIPSCDRDRAAGWGRFWAMTIALALGIALMLVARELAPHEAGPMPDYDPEMHPLARAWLGLVAVPPGGPDPTPILFWALAALPIFAAGRVLRSVATRAVARFSRQAAWTVCVPPVGLALPAGLAVARQLPFVWQLAVGVSVGIIVYALVAEWSLRRLDPHRAMRWTEALPRAAEHRRDAARDVSTDEEPSRPWWEYDLGFEWLFVPELGFKRWTQALRRTVTLFAVAALVFVVGWPLLARVWVFCAYLYHHYAWPSQPLAIQTEELALGAQLCLHYLPLAAIAFCLGIWWEAYPSKRRRIGDLLPVDPRARWRAKLFAAIVLSVAFVLLAEASGLLGGIIARALGAVDPIPARFHWMVLAAPALALIAWAQGPLLRNAFRVARCMVSLWPYLAFMATTAYMAGLVAIAEGQALHICPILAWPAAVVVLVASWFAVRPNAWSLREDGRAGSLATLLAGLALILSMVTAPLLVAAVAPLPWME